MEDRINQVFKCDICGNVVEMLYDGNTPVSCCGQPMISLVAESKEESKEKHVPVITKTPEGLLVKIGSTPHPMTQEHYIVWVELVVGDEVYRRQLKPGMKPELLFRVHGEDVKVRCYCNLDGMWKNWYMPKQ